MANWPTHPDGTNKRVGDMTPEERKRVFAEAAARVKADFERPEVQRRMAELLDDDTATTA